MFTAFSALYYFTVTASTVTSFVSSIFLDVLEKMFYFKSCNIFSTSENTPFRDPTPTIIFLINFSFTGNWLSISNDFFYQCIRILVSFEEFK